MVSERERSARPPRAPPRLCERGDKAVRELSLALRVRDFDDAKEKDSEFGTGGRAEYISASLGEVVVGRMLLNCEMMPRCVRRARDKRAYSPGGGGASSL